MDSLWGGHIFFEYFFGSNKDEDNNSEKERRQHVVEYKQTLEKKPEDDAERKTMLPVAEKVLVEPISAIGEVNARLLQAASAGREKIVKECLDQGASVNARGM
jgi:hypothetical protein